MHENPKRLTFKEILEPAYLTQTIIPWSKSQRLHIFHILMVDVNIRSEVSSTQGYTQGQF